MFPTNQTYGSNQQFLERLHDVSPHYVADHQVALTTTRPDQDEVVFRFAQAPKNPAYRYRSDAAESWTPTELGQAIQRLHRTGKVLAQINPDGRGNPLKERSTHYFILPPEDKDNDKDAASNLLIDLGVLAKHTGSGMRYNDELIECETRPAVDMAFFRLAQERENQAYFYQSHKEPKSTWRQLEEAVEGLLQLTGW